MLSDTELDEINIHLLHALQEDARSQFSKIAKACGVTTDTISKRFRKLKNSGVIKQTTVLLNPRSFGIDCIANLSVDVEGNSLFPHVKDVVMFINELPDIVFCSPTMGKHTVFAIVTCKDLAQLNSVKQHIKDHPLVRQVTTNIWINDAAYTQVSSQKNVTQFDQTDLAIIQAMTKDARTSFRKIAKERAISPDTVMNRYKKLRENHIIRGSTVILDPTKLGYSAMVAFLIGITSAPTQDTNVHNRASMVLDNLISMPSILLATQTLGAQDVLAIGVIRGFKHLIQLNNDIARISGIENIELSFWDITRWRTELCPKYFGI